jgi:hypothetical protein
MAPARVRGSPADAGEEARRARKGTSASLGAVGIGPPRVSVFTAG